MHTTQAIFSALLLSIIAAAGLVKGVDSAWIFAGITAALAFFSEEVRNTAVRRGDASDYYSELLTAGAALAMMSWATGFSAAFSILVRP